MKATALTRQILHAACWVNQAGLPPGRPSGAPDWNDLVDRASRLGVVSHLHHFVSAGPCDAPTEVRQRLSALHLRQAADAVMIHEQLRETVAVLHEAGIHVIVLKGAALALGVYQDVAVRPMRDLDLLVQEDQLGAADKVLTGQGYRPDEFYKPRDWWVEHHHHLIPLVRDGRPVPIELHRDLVPPSSGMVTDLAGLWQRAEPASVAGVPTLCLSHEDLLLHLSQHLDRLLGKLGALRDIAEVLVKKRDTDWPGIIQAAKQSRSAGRVYCALKLARSFAGAPVPTSALDALRFAAGFTVIEDLSLEAIGERALTWTDERGWQTAYLSDCGSALLGGTGVSERISAVTRALWGRAIASGRRRTGLAQPIAVPTPSSRQS